MICMFKVTLYYLQVYLRILETNPAHLKLELLTNVDMLLMVEKGIKGGIFHEIHTYAKANNKYMKNNYKNKESSYIQYLDANNLHEWAVSQKLSVNRF